MHQGYVVYDVQQTMQEGRRTTARVAHFELKSMAAQTHGLVTLEYADAAGDMVQRDLTLPATFASRIQGASELEIQVPGQENRQPVILRLRRVQRRMALINTAMAALGTMLAVGGLWAWGRTIRE